MAQARMCPAAGVSGGVPRGMMVAIGGIAVSHMVKRISAVALDFE